MCDYVLIIEKGKILASDYMTNLKERHSTGTAKIRFYQPGDAMAFQASITKHCTAEAQASPLELLLHTKTGNMQELSHTVTNLLQTHGIAMEHFGAHTPHLEDIFYEVIGK